MPKFHRDRRGGRLVYALVRADQDIWRVSGPGAAQPGAPTRFAVSSTRSEYLPVYSPDGSQVAFGSDQSGGIEIWRSDAEGRDLRELTHLGTTFLGEWSPCGKHIAFAGESERGWDVLVVDVAGGLPRNATPDEYADSLASWSPDGRWIYYSSERAGTQQIFKVPAEGGNPEQITREGGASPRATRNGLILFSRGGAIWGLSESGGKETLILDEDIPYYHWCVWNDSIVYIADGSVKEFDVTTREITWHRDLEGNPGLGLTVSPDGRWILYSVVASLSSDLKLVEGFD